MLKEEPSDLLDAKVPLEFEFEKFKNSGECSATDSNNNSAPINSPSTPTFDENNNIEEKPKVKKCKMLFNTCFSMI
jgi:heme-binding NEAT domain protein